MKKISIITSVVLICILVFATKCFATDINMNLSSENNMSDNSVTSNAISNNLATSNTTSGSNTTNNLTTTVGSANQTSAESSFGISEVINILLIVVGFVLILLAIAILIRMNH